MPQEHHAIAKCRGDAIAGIVNCGFGFVRGRLICSSKTLSPFESRITSIMVSRTSRWLDIVAQKRADVPVRTAKSCSASVLPKRQCKDFRKGNALSHFAASRREFRREEATELLGEEEAPDPCPDIETDIDASKKQDADMVLLNTIDGASRPRRNQWPTQT